MVKNKSKYISVGQVADYLEVSKQAVNTWINAGDMEVDRLPSGRIKILRTNFLNYLKNHNLYIDRNFFNVEPLNVVVIDDDKNIVNFIKRFFLNINYTGKVEFSNDGITGLIKIGMICADVVLLDLEMPYISGLDVCKRIRYNRFLSNTKIIVFTGYLGKYIDDLKELGIEKIIEKPFTYKDLEAKLIPDIYES